MDKHIFATAKRALIDLLRRDLLPIPKREGVANGKHYIIDRSDFQLVDKNSGFALSATKVLALAWYAVTKDDEAITEAYLASTAFKEVKDLAPVKMTNRTNFVEALYTLQRWYNKDGIDDMGEDRFNVLASSFSADDDALCVDGSLESITQKLLSLHPDIEFVMCNDTTAADFLPKITKQIAVRYLSLQCLKQPVEYKALAQQIKDHDLSIIWHAIEKDIANYLLDPERFLSLYKDRGGETGPAFTGLLAAGKDIELSPEHLQEPERRVAIITEMNSKSTVLTAKNAELLIQHESFLSMTQVIKDIHENKISDPNIHQLILTHSQPK